LRRHLQAMAPYRSGSILPSPMAPVAALRPPSCASSPTGTRVQSRDKAHVINSRLLTFACLQRTVCCIFLISTRVACACSRLGCIGYFQFSALGSACWIIRHNFHD
jgi:hypothetical protein